MDEEMVYSVSPPEPPSTVVMPDGSQPQPLGSGYITALIGSGAMSNVYRIWNPQLETLRAVKLMKPDLSAQSRQRFQTEMKIMAALSHPNIIEIHSVGEWNSLSYIEMELIDGHTLSEIIAQKGALPAAVCTAVGIMVARALMYAHDKEYTLFGKSYHGVIHRDLKPSNLMIAKEGKVKLMDFGIARPVDSSLMTMDGAVMGTMQYLSPEQIDGKHVSVASDIYALGEVLYETLTGRKAFPQKNLAQLMAAKTSNDFLPLRFFKRNISPALRGLVGKCMLFDPKKRPRCAEAVLKELERAHRRETLDSPEEVLRGFLRSPLEEKTELVFRKPLPVRAIITGSAVAAAIAAVCIAVAMPRKPVASLPPSPITRAAVKPDVEVKQSGPPADAPKKPIVAPAVKRMPRKTAAAAAQHAPSVIPEKISYLEEIKARHGTGSPLEALAKEAELGRFESVLRLFGELPPEVAGENNALLLRLRALYALGKRTEADDAAKQRTIDDGEYYLIKAKLSYAAGEAGQALKMLEKSLTVRAQMLDAETVQRDYLFYRAQCLGHMFDQAPSDDNRKNALDAWFEVKNYLRKIPDHSYFKKAVVEMQRIGDAYIHGKG